MLDVHKNQQPPPRHLEFLPESKIRIHFLFIFRNINKFTCSFVLFHLFCMLVCTEKLYTEILSSDLRIYLNLVILAGIMHPRGYFRTQVKSKIPGQYEIYFADTSINKSALGRVNSIVNSKVLNFIGTQVQLISHAASAENN